MSVARLKCRAQIGLTAPEVEVEVHLGSGLPTFSIVGLAATAVKESKERVRAALVNSGLEFPAGRITVNLAPADLPKDGGRFDLAIAVGIALASGQVSRAHGELQPDDALEFYGELGLGGEVRAVPGMLLAARCATQAQRALIMPAESALETLLVPDCSAWCADTLLAVCEHLQGTRELHPPAIAAPQLRSAPSRPLPSLDDVCGQALAKRALVVAAAGGHSLLLVGPPGCGKTLLAQRLTTLLPPLTQSEALDVATIASIAGQRGAEVAQPARPFRAPHHTASATAIVGGGPRARPGDVTLAHHGVLFLDEFPEFDRRVLEALREPLENGAVSIARASCHAEYPARFQLIAAMNPCGCGHRGDPRRDCRCTPAELLRYRRRLSGPLLDRIDLRVELRSVSEAEIAAHERGSAREAVPSGPQSVQQVSRARELQRARSGKLNAHLAAGELRAAAAITAEARRVFEAARTALGLSLRGYHRSLRVARTLADLADAGQIGAAHAAEAIQLRRALSD